MKLLRHASIGTKVAVAPLVAIACLAVVAGVGLWSSLHAGRALAEIHQARMPGVTLAAEIERRIAALNGSVNQSLVWEGAGVKAPTIAALDKRIGDDFKALGEFIQSQQANAAWGEEDRATMERIAAVFEQFRAASADTLDIKGTGLGAAAGFITRGESSYNELNRLTGDLVGRQQAQTEAVVLDAGALARRHRAATVAALVAAMALSGLATWWCRRLIVGPLEQASRIAAAVAAGDLQPPAVAAAQDETGRMLAALRDVTASLGGIVEEIKASAAQIDGASDEIAQGNDHLSRRTEQAAASLQQTAASLEQLTASVRQSAGNAVDADRLANQAAQHAREGGDVVRDAVQSMEAISTQSRRIGEIVGVIDGIAFQTNILALNAAVEAARAGESGRGFAVVAQEVRTLAQRSATAAKEIRQLISHSVDQIAAGAGKVRVAGDSMQQIVDSVQRVSVVIGSISTATSEQASGIAQINTAIGEMDRFTQQNAALVQKAAASAESLKHQSERLTGAVAVFRTAHA